MREALLFLSLRLAFAAEPEPISSANEVVVQEVERGALASRGESLGGGTVTRVQTHPEFQRYFLQWPDGTGISVELTRWDREHIGVCKAGELSIFPRPELQLPIEEPANASVAYDTLCARLEQQPTLQLAPNQSKQPKEPLTFLWLVVVLLPVALLLPLVALFRHLRRHARWLAEGAAWSLFGFLVRFLLIEPGIFNGAEAGYEKIVLALGRLQRSPYGEGFPTLFRPMLWIFGETPDGVFRTNLLFSSLTVGLVWEWVTLEMGRDAGRVAALLWAFLSVPLMLSRSEEMSVSVVMLGAIALCAIAGFRRGGSAFLPVLAAATLGLAVHTRPEALTLVPMVLVLGTRPISLERPFFTPTRWAGLLLGTLLIGVLIILRLPFDTHQNVLHPESLANAQIVRTIFVPELGHWRYKAQQLVLHLGFSPPLLVVLALAGIWQFSWTERLRWLLAWAVLTLPFVTKVVPEADLLRLQHPALLVWVLAAGMGGKNLMRSWVGPLLVIVGTAPWWWSPQPQWVNQQEARWLASVMPTFPSDRPIFYPDPLQRRDKFREVLEMMGPARWIDHREPGALLYVGVSCLFPDATVCQELQKNCALRPVKTVDLEGRADLDIDLGGAPTVTIGFYEVGDCKPGTEGK